MPKASWIGLLLAVAAVGAQAGDLVGSYRGTLDHNGRSYQARMAVRPSSTGFDMRLQVRGLGTKTLSATPKALTQDPVEFTKGATPGSLASSLLGTAKGGAWSRVRLCSDAKGWSGTFSDSKGFEATLAFTREQRAVVFYATHYAEETGFMRKVAEEVAELYRTPEFAASDALGVDTALEVLATLETAAAHGRPYHRVVFVSHAGWDGPMLADGTVPGSPMQFTNRPIDSDVTEDPTYTFWPRFVSAIKAGTTGDARIYAAGCHGGGGNRFERAEFQTDGFNSDADYSWSREVAKATGRTVAGPAGSTNLKFAARQTWAALEGHGTVVQETLWTSPAGERTLRPSTLLADTPLVAVPALTPISANTKRNEN